MGEVAGHQEKTSIRTTHGKRVSHWALGEGTLNAEQGGVRCRPRSYYLTRMAYEANLQTPEGDDDTEAGTTGGPGGS